MPGSMPALCSSRESSCRCVVDAAWLTLVWVPPSAGPREGQEHPLIAAMPDAKACAAGQLARFGPSSAAMARANVSTVGLSIRL